jgi:hypothetical protein
MRTTRRRRAARKMILMWVAAVSVTAALMGAV